MSEAPARSARARLRFGSAAVAAAGGALWALCFQKEPLLVAPWLALVPYLLTLGVGSPRPWLNGWLHGFSFWVCAMPWIAPTVETFGGLPVWLSWLAVVLMALYLGAYTGLFAALAAPLWRAGAGWALLGVPAAWVATEWLREWVLTGFPWNLAGYAVMDVPGVLGVAPWIGVWGASWIAVLVNVAVARSVVDRRWALGAWTVLAVATLLSFGARWGGPTSESAPGTGESSIPVRIVQPNIPNLVGAGPEAYADNYRKAMRWADRACDEPGALVILPESATWPYGWDNAPTLRADLGALADRGCRVLLNSPSSEGDSVYNSVILVGAGGIEGRYDKRRLVPWGEYVPLRDALPFMKKMARMAGDFSPGRSVDLLPLSADGTERLGMGICYEIVYPALTAELVRAGATALVTVTNDAWYGDSSAPWQHFRAARFRAAELSRPLFRAAITGVSADVAADGSVRSMLGVDEEGVIAAQLPGRSEITPFARAPWALPSLSWAVLLLGWVARRVW